MSDTEVSPSARWTRRSAALGFLLWLPVAIYFITRDPFIGLLRAILCLGILVIVPLGLTHLCRAGANGRAPVLLRLAAWLQPLAAVSAVVALAQPFGLLAGALAVPWLGVTGLIGLAGLLRAWRGQFAAIEERAIDFASMYLPVGGAWLVLWTSGRVVLGFEGAIVILTAIHFHYAGFAAPLVAGLAGRVLYADDKRAWRLYRVATPLVVAGPPMIAIGITTSPIVEFVFAVALAAGMLLLGGLLAFVVGPRSKRRLVSALLALAAASLVATMALACLYAAGEWTNRTLIQIDTMAKTHGIANSLGFALPALLALTLLAPAPKR
jgi:hypothetical protein